MNNKRDDLRWEEIRTEHVVRDEWIDLRKSAYRMPDGTVSEPYYSYSRRDYVVIVPTDVNGDYICVRQFRQGIREVTTEFPAGGIERSGKAEYRRENETIDDTETALNAARRELREETGYTSDEWEELLKVPSNATIADNYAYIFRAKNCRKTDDQELDDTEFLNVERHSTEEIESLIKKEGFQQAIHVMAYYMSR